MDNSSGVGVLDKANLILDALEAGPLSLAGLVEATGIVRPTAHRLAMALEHHRLIGRDLSGRFILGPRVGELATAAGDDKLLATAAPILNALAKATHESTQLYRRQGDQRICVAAIERASGLRDSVPIGSVLTMSAGSAAQVLLAWEEADRLHRGLKDAKFTATDLSKVRRQGFAQSSGEREPGVASISAPVRSASGRVIAAISISGPIDRITNRKEQATAVVNAAMKISELLRNRN